MTSACRWLVAPLLFSLGLAAVACGDDRDDAEGATRRSLHVFAAASLTEVFGELSDAFERDHPDTTIRFNFAASSALAQQINGGARADVFVSADESTMAKVTAAGIAVRPETMARNRLAILVERGNPKAIDGLVDLANPDVLLVLCAPAVPCGALAAAALQHAGVHAKPSSLEENVKAVVSRVTLGEADAGIVYVTDVKAAGDNAEGVNIDSANEPRFEAVYPVAMTRAATNRDGALQWIDFVLSDRGQAILRSFGFVAP